MVGNVCTVEWWWWGCPAQGLSYWRIRKIGIFYNKEVPAGVGCGWGEMGRDTPGGLVPTRCVCGVV